MNPTRDTSRTAGQTARRHAAGPATAGRIARRPAALLIGLVVPLALLAFGCSQNPQEPVFANPFDPRTPGSDDPFRLRALYANQQVTLSWTPLAGHGIETYAVYRISQGIRTELGRLEPQNGAMSYVVRPPLPNLVNTYLVRGLDAAGLGVASSDVVPVEVVVPPLLATASGQTQIRSRFQDIVVRGVPGDQIEVDTLATFATAMTALVGDDSTAVAPAFDLGPRPSPAARCTLYASAVHPLGGGQPPLRSDVDRLVLRIAAGPTIVRPDSQVTVAEPVTALLVSHQAAGVQSMRFAPTVEALADSAWRPGAELVEDVPLLDTTLPQTVHAEFLSDFGFTTTTSLDLVADDLAAAAFALDGPGGGITSDPRVPVVCQAVATEMRLSRFPDFRDAPWRPYQARDEIVLDGPPGSYRVFARFRNHWFTSAVLSEAVILAGAGPWAAFTSPEAGMLIAGGETVALAGRAGSLDGEPVVEVQVRTSAEGPWRTADGTQEWSAVWEAPLPEADTVQALGARAITAGDEPDTAAVWIEVTVTPAPRRQGG